MPVSLKKGQGVSLKKAENDLSLVTIGLGWDIAEPPKSMLQKIGLGSSKATPKPVDYDLDVVAFVCGADGKVRDRGPKNDLVGSDVIFYNNLRHESGSIWLTGDNRDGSGDGDDEQIIVKLNDLPSSIQKIVFVVQIYHGRENNQSFGQVNNAFIRAADAKGKEMVRFDLSDGEGYAEARSLHFAELVRTNSDWQFEAIGVPSPEDSFTHWLKAYL